MRAAQAFRVGGRADTLDDQTVINRGSSMPLHTQFRAYLLGLIERGELRSGQKLPTEKDYAEQLGVSLAPVRQAILDLVTEGYLSRTRGKGTFVRESKVDEKIAILSSFTESMRAKGLEPDVRILHWGLVAAPSAVAGALGTQERKLLLIRRLALVDGQPAALIDAYVSARMFPKLLRKELYGGSLYRTLEALYGVLPVRATSTIEVSRIQDDAELLGVAPGTPVLQVEGTTFDASDRPVEFSRVTYRADRFRFVIESYRRQDRVIHLVGSAQT